MGEREDSAVSILKGGWGRAREQEAWGLPSSFQYDLFCLAFDRIISPHLLLLPNPAFFLALFALLLLFQQAMQLSYRMGQSSQ